jgi:GrpB-like predicted nucleotidyltransferase (UPF0157 family)
VPTPEAITTFLDSVEGENPWVRGAPPTDAVVIVDADPTWPVQFDQLAADLHAALGRTALSIEHVGSTSVPDLAAKPVIDIDLTVADTRHEDDYVPALVAIGYWLVIREPGWYEHRCLRLDKPRVNLHVWEPDCPEAVRHQLFRDWLRTHPNDRRAYEDAKRAAVPGGGHVMDYNRRKEAVMRAIYGRIFVATGLVT